MVYGEAVGFMLVERMEYSCFSVNNNNAVLILLKAGRTVKVIALILLVEEKRNIRVTFGSFFFLHRYL